MPYISTRTTEKITPEKELKLKSALGRAIELFPGKTERWLMTDFTGDCHIYFAGDGSAPCAFFEVKIFGSVNKKAAADFTAELCKIAEEVLSVSPDRVYVTYSGFEDWGWNGGNF